MLAFTTSSTKKRKLSPQHISGQGTDRGPDIPLTSVEDRESQSPTDLPLFDTTAQESHRAESLPPNTLPPHLQSSTTLSAADYISSAASSPSAAYAGLSIDSDRSGDIPNNFSRRRFPSEPIDVSSRSKSPRRSFNQRGIMGGAEDVPPRSSSPLKRPAADLEHDASSSQKDDVDMITVSNTESQETEPAVADDTTVPVAARAESVDMLRDEPTPETSDTPAATTQNNPSADELPSYDVQIKTVTTLREAADEKQAAEGDSRFLVSKKWYSKFTSKGSGAKSKEETDGEIGPIDNSDIISRVIHDAEGKDFVQLRHGTGESDFELIPEDAWSLLLSWYDLKPEAKAIERFAHNTNPEKDGIPNIQYEFHPPVFTVHRVWSEQSNKLDAATKSKNPDAPVFVMSRSAKFHDFLVKMKKSANIPMENKRVPRSQPAADQVPTPVPAGNSTPPSSRPGSPAAGVSVNANPTTPEVQDTWKKLLLDVNEFIKLETGRERELVDYKDSTTTDNYDGHRDLAFVGLGDDQALVLDENIEGKIFVSHNTSASAKANGVARKGNSSFIASSQNNSGRSSPAPSGYNLRSTNRGGKNGRVPGTVGLSNLGNTCYMNSALQCVRSVEELTKYFLSDAWQPEINEQNVLGHGGQVAKAYASLLKDIYKEPAAASVTPRNFKSTVGRFAPSFSGYGQQDSQEFLGFLLDGLQEDLSRVKKKPYIEKPDSTDEMISNPEAIKEMAAKVWSITKQRDDSVIADLFTGMYKSTLVCPVCDKVSITFDPFNNLTLQLPIENSWSHTISYYPLSDKPVQIVVDINKNASIKAMKDFVSKRVGVPTERLMIAEEFKQKFYKFLEDADTASESIQSSDTIDIYELEAKPTNWPALPKAKKQRSMISFGSNDSDVELPQWGSPACEKMLVPVFYRKPSQNNGRGKKPWAVAPVPHFIILTPREAANEDLIKRKLLEKVSTFTKSNLFHEFYEDEDPASAEPDMIVTTASDADSSGEGKVVANSLDGEEDGIVDVQMKDSCTESKTSEPQISRPPMTSFNSRRPTFLDPKVYVPPALQNLFELCYFTTKEPVPTGWSIVDDDKAYPTLASRNPPEPESNDEESSYGSEARNSRAGSEDSRSSISSVKGGEYTNYEAAKPYEQNVSDEDVSSDEQSNYVHSQNKPPPIRHRGGHKASNGKKRRRMKTYSKKGARAARKQQQKEDIEQDTSDDGPLIRPGEGIVVDWTAEGWRLLFDDEDKESGPTYTQPQILVDQELTAKRKERAMRRTNGISLDDCLDEFGKEEILSEMDTWFCPRCKEHRRASKKFELWKTPDILIMHLKRFSSGGFRRDKIDVLVDFPIEGLDLTSRVLETQDGKDEVYDLIAVDDHWGGLGGGHYTAFAKNFVDGQWYEYNDASVSKQKDTARVVSPSAYLLFYRRRSSEPLGGKNLQEIMTSFENPPSDDDDSGEDRRLVGNSSLTGSSSALTGVGAVHPLPHPDLGSGGGERVTRTLNRSVLSDDDDEGLPPPAYADLDADGDDAMPLLEEADVRASIEGDEGIDMTMGLGNSNPNEALIPSWDFSALGANPGFGSRRGSEVGAEFDSLDGVSDGVQHGSDVSVGSMEDRRRDFDDALPVGEDGAEWVDEALEVPDCELPVDAGDLGLMGMGKGAEERDRDMDMERSFDVGVAGEEGKREEEEEPVKEIHVEEGEGLKGGD
ncbi:ubiquitin carboxyl-terminal hydrolase protein [Rutstroemia sp. NJR-2017a BBW]|nr:ubiquitin carboxyl-terminal hydrolase protein [Rutstroemia sp. NJR-2017a BBW]